MNSSSETKPHFSDFHMHGRHSTLFLQCLCLGHTFLDGLVTATKDVKCFVASPFTWLWGWINSGMTNASCLVESCIGQGSARLGLGPLDTAKCLRDQFCRMIDGLGFKQSPCVKALELYYSRPVGQAYSKPVFQEEKKMTEKKPSVGLLQYYFSRFTPPMPNTPSPPRHEMESTENWH